MRGDGGCVGNGADTIAVVRPRASGGDSGVVFLIGQFPVGNIHRGIARVVQFDPFLLLVCAPVGSCMPHCRVVHDFANQHRAVVGGADGLPVGQDENRAQHEACQEGGSAQSSGALDDNFARHGFFPPRGSHNKRHKLCLIVAFPGGRVTDNSVRRKGCGNSYCAVVRMCRGV